jgi:hypothetical protein
MRASIAVALASTVSGCAGSLLGDAMAGPEAVAAREDAYCQSIGLRFGTPEYANCRMATTHQRQQNHQATIQNFNWTPVQQQQQRLQTNCTTRKAYGTTYTDYQ